MRPALMFGGLSTMVVGAAGSFLVFLQPWKSCIEDDGSAGCPTSGPEAALLAAFMVLTVVGLVMVVVALSGDASRRQGAVGQGHG